MKNINFAENYMNWLNSNTSQLNINDKVTRLTSPFLDFNNDSIEVYIIKKENKFILTDMGNTISELKFSGMDIHSSKRRTDLFHSTLNSFGASYSNSDNSVYIETNLEDYPIKQHLLLQCILKLNDMLYLSKPTVKSLFSEDVQSYFDSNDILYTANINFIGKSKLNNNFDYAIPVKGDKPEKIIKLTNNLSRPDTAKSIIFSWNDTTPVRPNSVLYTIINDENKPSNRAMEALKEYGIHPVKWSERDQYVNQLRNS